MKFKIAKCPRCGEIGELVPSNNPIVQPICFDCIKKILKYNDIKDADIFCRSYNLPFDPNLWIKMAESLQEEVFQQYTEAQLNEDGTIKYTNKSGPTYDSLNEQWRRARSQAEIIARVQSIKDAYQQREGLIWGSQYSFEELLELDSLYIQTIQANNITNPLQKKSLKTLLKVMIDMDKAILTHDTGSLKDLSSTYNTLSKTAQLDQMIEDTKTDDMTTLAEVAELVERNGFDMTYYDKVNRDGIDVAIKNIQETNARLIRDATGLGPMIESMMSKMQEGKEVAKATESVQQTPIIDLEDAYDNSALGEEEDTEITKETFDDDE